MALRYNLIILAIFTCCSKPNTDTTNNKVPDSTDSDVHSVSAEDSSYVGYVSKFEDNNTFYTDLYFADGFNYDQFDELRRMNDGVVFESTEITRRKIPRSAERYFNLTGLENINIYNEENVRLTTGRFSHVEYFEDPIDGRFVAVFTVDNPNIAGYIFCIGNPKKELPRTASSSFDDEALDSKLIGYLKLDPSHHTSISHYKVSEQIIYSTVTADTASFITETQDGNHKTLFVSESDETINGLMIVARQINGRPILLADCGMHETDMTWSSLLVFNGSEYRESKSHRIK